MYIRTDKEPVLTRASFPTYLHTKVRQVSRVGSIGRVEIQHCFLTFREITNKNSNFQTADIHI